MSQCSIEEHVPLLWKNEQIQILFEMNELCEVDYSTNILLKYTYSCVK